MPCGVLHAAVQAGDALRRFARSSSGGGMPRGVLCGSGLDCAGAESPSKG